MQETTNYNLKKYDATDTGSFLSGFNPNMDTIDSALKMLELQDSQFSQQLQTMLSQHITPIFVDSTSEMTDTGTLYVLKSSGKIYSYNASSEQFENTGVDYAADITNYYDHSTIEVANTAISDLTEPGFYFYSTGVTPTDTPYSGTRALLVYNFDGTVGKTNLQICTSFTTGNADNPIYYRYRTGSGSYGAWNILTFSRGFVESLFQSEMWYDAKTKYNYTLFSDIDRSSSYYVSVSASSSAPEDSPFGTTTACRVTTLTRQHDNQFRLQFCHRYNSTQVYMRYTRISNNAWAYSDWIRIDNEEIKTKLNKAFISDNWQDNPYGFELLSEINMSSTFYISVGSDYGEPNDAPVPYNVAGRCTTLTTTNSSSFRVQIFYAYNKNKTFIRWTRVSGGTWSYTDWKPILDSDWYNKEWYAYGTSMTAYTNQTLSNGLIGKGYAEYLPALSGLNLHNFGKGGSGIIPSLHGGLAGDNTYTRVMDNTDGKLNADLITLEILPNDMSGTLGELSDVWDGVEGSDSETFMGCLAKLLDHLLSTTTAQIVVLIAPTSRYQLNHPENTYTAEDHIRWLDWIKAVKDKCAIYQVPVISCSDGCALSPSRVVGNNTYVGDQIHLVAAGGYNLAQFYWSKLKDIPLWYTSAQ